ncbi:MAG: proline iminopeptidase-family hydrolase, partial [Gemmatimonadetes bacterium]|nr:proline iminopeptidase-family hydrolase [Gemmatimonadota bacterium]
ADRPVVFYDQLGCGKSARPEDPSLWRAERFVRELARVREALGLDRVHLFGHSWGTMLAVDALLDGSRGVESLVLASPALSIPRWLSDAARLRLGLSQHVHAVLEAHEAAGTTSTTEYREACKVYYRKHLCRMDPWPEPMQRSHQGSSGDVYHTMWGPSEFHATGNLKDYDRSHRLGEIDVPALVTCGRHDEATPEASEWYCSLMPRAELEVFELSAHMAHLEEPDRYIERLRSFLALH